MSETGLRLTERGKNVIAASVAALALGGVGIAAEHANSDSSIYHDTHEEKISVTAGTDGNTETDLAHTIQDTTHTPDPTELLVGRLTAVDPGHDAEVAAGQRMTITVEVPNERK